MAGNPTELQGQNKTLFFFSIERINNRKMFFFNLLNNQFIAIFPVTEILINGKIKSLQFPNYWIWYVPETLFFKKEFVHTH
jgi:hypothetical protein